MLIFMLHPVSGKAVFSTSPKYKDAVINIHEPSGCLHLCLRH